MYKLINYSFLFIIGVACYLPEIFIFTDTLLLPKWYLAISGLLVWLLYLNYVRLFTNKSVKELVSLFYIKHLFLLLAVGECLYVVVHSAIYGFSAAGERGTFDNPAGLGVCIAISFAIAIDMTEKSKGRKALVCYLLCILLFISVIFLSKSRTGLICIILMLLYSALKLIRRSKWGKIVLSLCLIGVSVFVVVKYKKDSTSGRYFILSNSYDLICEHPFVGHGQNGFEREYMLKQADYFRHNEGSKYEMLADEIQHPLNEFVYVWINYGIVGPLVMLLVFVVPAIIGYRRNDKRLISMQKPMLIIFIFCLFSYPLNYPLPCGIILLDIFFAIRHCCWSEKVCELFRIKSVLVTSCAFLLLCLVGAFAKGYNEYRWNNAWRHLRKNITTALDEYRVLEPYFSANRYFLYNYAFALYSKGEFAESITILNKCSNYWNGYNHELLSGDACRMNGRYVEAIKHYDEAHFMCPSRLAPLEGLYYVYGDMDDDVNRKRIADIISKQKLKVPSYDGYRIKRNCK